MQALKSIFEKFYPNRNVSPDLQAELEERQRLITELEIKNAESETLHESLASIVGTFEFSEIIQRVYDQMKRVIPYDTASVWRVEGNKQKLIGGRDLPPEILQPNFEFIISDSNAALPVLRGEAPYVLYNNVQEETDEFNEPPHNYVHSWLVMPLKIKGAIIGVIALDGKSKNQFNVHHAELASTFANQVAIALDNAQLVSKLQEELAERKNAEENLRQAEFKYRTLIEQIPPIVFTSAHDQHIGVTYISPRITSLGFTEEEWLADPELWLKQIHPDDRARILEEIEEIKQNEKAFKSEYRLRTRDGAEKWFLEETMNVIDSDGNFVFRQGFMLDIDERKRAEEIIRQRESILETIAFAAEQFFKSADWRVNINIVLEHLGIVIDCSHVYIFENFISQQNQQRSRMTYEWTAPSYLSDLGDEKYQNLLLQEDKFDYWYELLSNGKPYVSSSPSLPDEEKTLLRERSIKALVDIPIYVNGKWWGIIGFDDVVKEREWSIAELDALKVASDVFGAAIQRQQAELEIHQINLELEQRIEQRTAQLQEVNLSLNQEKARLEQFNRQHEIMAAMTDLLQASLTMEEATNIISSHFKLLFPDRDGALYLTNSSNSFEPIVIWGEKESLDLIYTTNECWGLRRGKPYRFGTESPNPACVHIGSKIPELALCIPLSAQGESLGNLHISTKKTAELINDEEQKFIETIADSIALAIANLRLRQKLHFESIRDGLTGLFNRRYLDETLPREIHRAERSKNPISVLMFDIDHFKKFNDTFGHDAGDVILKNIASLILSGVRESDIACRYGGEEFVIILPDTLIEVAAHRAENLRLEASNMELHHNGRNIGKVTISIGVATYPQHGTTRDTLIKSADEAAYQAKEGGRNLVVVSK